MKAGLLFGRLLLDIRRTDPERWERIMLKISVMSLIRFISGGYPLRDVFAEGN